MNILVSLAGGSDASRFQYCFRPDTTIEKEDFNYYIPDGITNMSYSPIFFVRISRAGKAIGSRFADRYYDAGGYGALLYGEDLISEGSEAGFAMASSLDRTSILPFPLYGKNVLDNKDNLFALMVNGEEGFRWMSGTEAVPETLHRISTCTSLRTGDIVAIELAARKPLNRGDRLEGFLNGRNIFTVPVL